MAMNTERASEKGPLNERDFYDVKKIGTFQFDGLLNMKSS